MAISMLADMTAPYSAIESYAYDAIIAPAVIGLSASLETDLLARLPRGARLLEVGCGGGHLAVRLLGLRDDVSLVGLDLSPEQVARASRRAQGLGHRARFVVGSALEMPFADGSFDAVISVASIKHWPDQARGMRECARVLAPGGALAVIEADRGCRLADARAFVDRWRIPRPMRRAALPFFRTFVAGQGLDLDDARALVDALPLAERRVERIAGTPGLVMLGQKRAG